MEEEMLYAICGQLQKKYELVSDIYQYTRDLGESLSRNDRVSVQMILTMRQDAMNETDECEKNLHLFVDALPINYSQAVWNIIKGQEEEKEGILAQWEESKRLWQLGLSIRNVLRKTIEIDKAISSRLAGKDSFYAQQGQESSLSMGR